MKQLELRTCYLVAQELQIRGLGHVINASMLIFIISLANTALYIASRTLYGLGVLKQAPKIFRRVTKRGVPVWALLFSWLFSFLVFMDLGPQDGMLVTSFFRSATDILKQPSSIWSTRQ